MRNSIGHGRRVLLRVRIRLVNITNAHNIHVNGTKPIPYMRVIMIDFKYCGGENGSLQGLGKRERKRIRAAPVPNET